MTRETSEAPEASGLVIHFVRCNAPPRFPEWGRWLEEVHLPDLRAVEGVRAATHWALTQQPEPGMPSVGFSHVILIELSGDLEAGAAALRERQAELLEKGRLDPNHCVVNVDRLRAHGRFSHKPMPGPQLYGHIMAYVMPNDPRLEEEWNRFNDEMHMPDMLDSGGFLTVSRWVRDPKSAQGTNYLTLYDVGEGGVEQAVQKSAAVMPGLAAAGRKMECHVGGLTVTLQRP